MKRSYLETILFSFLLMACAASPGNAQAEEPFFHVTVENLDDEIKVVNQNSQTLIDVYSPTGIGSATFELESGSMPRVIILRLHLQGLEEFRLTAGQQEVAASVSSRDPSDIQQKAISSGSEAPILPADPLWMKTEIVSPQSDAKIPLAEGYFEVTIAEEFLRKAGNSFEVQWVDFYR